MLRLRFQRTVAIVTATITVLAIGLVMLPAVDAVTSTANNLGNTCKVDPKHPTLQDVDPTEKLTPWKRNGAKQVVVYFAAGQVTAQYRADLQFAAKVWSRSNCIEARVVSKCPAKRNCVVVSLKNSGGADAEGLFKQDSMNGYTLNGSIEFYTDKMSGNTQNERRSTIIHEMGHALGLVHRKSQRAVMVSFRNEGITKLDAIDFQNLRVLYGSQK